MSSDRTYLVSADETFNSHLALAERLRALGAHKIATKIEDCGKRYFVHEEGRVALPRWCRLKVCPLCRVRLAKEAHQKHRAPLAYLMGSGGVAYFLTVTCPPSEKGMMMDAVRLHKELKQFNRSSWWGGLNAQATVITALEFGKLNGNAHGHHLVIGSSHETAAATVDGILSRWLQLHPEASLEGQDTIGPLTTVAAMEQWLGYITKGSRISVDWPDEAILAAVAQMTNRKRPLTASGLAVKRKPRPSAA